MAVAVSALLPELGVLSGRIQPVNYTPVDGDYALVFGSDIAGLVRDIAAGNSVDASQTFDFTSITSVYFAFCFRQTEGATAAARRGLSATYPKAFSTGDTFKLKVDGGSEQTITFVDTDTTLALIVDRINATLTGAVASDDNSQLKITSSTTGLSSSIEITGGTVYTDLGHTLGTSTGGYVTFKFSVTIDGVEHYSEQPAADEELIYARRTINTQHITGSKALRFILEAVAS